MARTQTLVQLNDELLAHLDQRAGRERRSRSDLIREAIEKYLSEDVEAELSRQIVAGYERIPQKDDDDLMRLAEVNAKRTIGEEPW